jgi:hypothetical protein
MPTTGCSGRSAARPANEPERSRRRLRVGVNRGADFVQFRDYVQERHKNMYEYHGWLSTLESLDSNNILKDLKKINGDYPVSAQYVNGNLHISFSGNPNRHQSQLDNLITYIRDLKRKLYGCIYINDANSDRYNKFDVIKIVEDKIIKMEDKNFTDEETKQLFD